MAIPLILKRFTIRLQEFVHGVRHFLYDWTPRSLPWYERLDNIDHGGRVAADGAQTTLTQAWDVVARDGTPRNTDFAFWWQATGPPLARLLHEAKYDSKSQQSHLRFYSKYLAHRLGPRPSQHKQPKSWRSFVTDDFSPIEYSWSWNKGLLDTPKVRYTIELVGPAAGSESDPFNAIVAMDAAQDIASNYPNVDLTWFNHFLSAFVDPHLPPPQSGSSDAIASPSSAFLAFDLNHSGGIAMKAYLIPVKAEQVHVSRLELVSDAIHSLPNDFPSLFILQSFLSSHPLGMPTSIVGLGVDCIHPSKARLRLYIRSPHTSLEKVSQVLTLSGALPTLRSEKALLKFRKLWCLVLSLAAEFPADAELRNADHETGGVLYSFDVKPGNLLPETKVYIPAKHYAENDGKAFQGVKTFLEEERKAQWVEGFENSLQSVWSRPWRVAGDKWETDGIGTVRWKERRGVQTYVGIGFEGDDLALTTYIAPGIYHGLREASMEEAGTN